MALLIRLPKSVAARLKRLAERTGRSKEHHARQAICQHIDELEDLYLAEQRLMDYRAGKTTALPLEDVLKQYGIDG